MTTFVLILHIIIAILMVGVILIQKSEGGGLGMGGGSMGGLMTTRGTANLLTRATAVLITLFFTTTIVLAILFKGSTKPKASLLDTIPEPSAPVVSRQAPVQQPEAPVAAPQTPQPTKVQPESPAETKADQPKKTSKES